MDRDDQIHFAYILGLGDAPVPSSVGEIIKAAEDRLGPERSVTWRVLDRLLRGEPTRDTALASQSGLLATMQWRCIVSTLGCLTLAQRIVWILVEVFDWSIMDVADLLGLSPSAVHVRRARARSVLERFESVCGHIEASNPCSCEGRIAVAISTGFLDGKGIASSAGYVPGEFYSAGALVRRVRPPREAPPRPTGIS